MKDMNKRFLGVALLFCIVIQGVLLASCNKNNKKTLEIYSAYSFDYFDTVTSIKGYAESEEAFNEISAELLDLLGEYHRLFTIYDRYEGLENLRTINDVKDGAHQVVKVDARIIDMLLYAKEMYAKTGGKVNVAMGSVLSIWHNYREAGDADPKNAELPPMEALVEAAEHTNIDDLIIDKEAGTVFLADPQMKLDVGAIAKGYAVEMVARSLEEKGIGGYVINVGGNVRTVGIKANGEKWIAGIENPDNSSDKAYLEYIALEGEALVTSGSYQRYYIVDGKAYHHIIDPDTLMPGVNYTSVSVVCKSSSDGDALSTALFCMTLEEGMALAESLDGIEVMWVLTDGTRHKTSGFDDHVTEI